MFIRHLDDIENIFPANSTTSYRHFHQKAIWLVKSFMVFFFVNVHSMKCTIEDASGMS